MDSRVRRGASQKKFSAEKAAKCSEMTGKTVDSGGTPSRGGGNWLKKPVLRLLQTWR